MSAPLLSASIVVASRNKRLANLLSEPGPDRDVLQVRVSGVQPAGCRGELLKGGVHTASRRPYRGGQRIRVSGLELGALAVFEQVPHDGVIGGQRDERLFVSGVLAGARLFRPVGNPEPLEQDLPELLG